MMGSDVTNTRRRSDAGREVRDYGLRASAPGRSLGGGYTKTGIPFARA